MKHFIVLFACFCLAFSVNLSAQNVTGSVEVGVYSAYQMGSFSLVDGINITTAKWNYIAMPYLPAFETIAFGGTIEYHTSPDIAFQGNLRFHQISGYTLHTQAEFLNVERYGKEQWTDIEYAYSITIPQVTAAFTNKIRLIDPGFCFVWGVSAGIIVGDKQEIECRLIDNPDHPGVTFDSLYYPIAPTIRGQTPVYLNDAHTALQAYSGPMYEKNVLQFGYIIGVQYDIPIYTTVSNKKVTLMPSILYNGFITKYLKQTGLSASSINFGIGLKMGI